MGSLMQWLTYKWRVQNLLMHWSWTCPVGKVYICWKILNNDTTKQATGKLRPNETLHPLGHVSMSDFFAWNVLKRDESKHHHHHHHHHNNNNNHKHKHKHKHGGTDVATSGFRFSFNH